MPSSAIESAPRDIYELLGISPTASAKMAQAMYWSRVRELRQAERAGDPMALEEIERLNQALQIVSDDTRRAAYDQGRREETGIEVIRPSERRGKRSPRLVAIGAGAFAGSVAALFGAEAAGVDLIAMPFPPLAVILVIGTLGAGLMGAGLQRRVIRTPFDVLELAPDATPEDIDFAYRTLASSWLAQLRSAPDLALESLEELDRAYAAAMAPHVGSRVLAGKGAAGRIGRGLWLAGRAFAGWLRRRDWHRLGAELVELARAIAIATARAVRWATVSLLAVYRGEEVNFGKEEYEAPEVQVDLQRRLSASVQVLAEETLEQPRPVGYGVLSDNLYEIVLETPVGARRIPVGERPLRIGSSNDADIAVERTEEEGNEQVLLWVNGQDLVLHATAGATCKVNGTPSTWARLEPGDAVTIGGTVLKVEPAA